MKRLVIVVGTILLAACGGDAGSSTRGPAPDSDMRIDITGFEFGYKVNTLTHRSGRLRMELTNEGVQPHQALLYRLHDGVDIEAFARSVMKDESTLPRLATAEGGMTRYAGTGETVVTEGRIVEPGNYAIVCFVRDQSLKTNKNHAELGMIAPLEVL